MSKAIKELRDQIGESGPGAQLTRGKDAMKHNGELLIDDTFIDIRKRAEL